MSRKERKILIIIICVFIFAILLPYPIYTLYVNNAVKQSKEFYEEIKDYPKVYCYDTTEGAINNVFFIKDLKDANSLIAYYDACINGVNPGIPFETLAMPLNKELFLIKYFNLDSSIVEVVDFNVDCWGYVKGYVDKRFIFDHPASKEKLKEDEEFWVEYKKSPSYQRNKIIAKKSSKYGIQCD